MKTNAADYCVREIMKGIESSLSEQVTAIIEEETGCVELYPMKNAFDLRKTGIKSLMAVRYPVLVYNAGKAYIGRKVG